MMDFTPEIVQVVPHEDYTVDVYFADGKIVTYNVQPRLESGVFKALKDRQIFMDRCCIMNDTLAWDVDGCRDESRCIDIDPDMLYALDESDETQLRRASCPEAV